MVTPRVRALALVLVTPIALTACERTDERAAAPTAPARAVASAAAGIWARIEASHSTSTCGVTTAEQGFCWGSNNRGEVGDGTVTFQSRPTPVAGGHPFVQISAGGELACGLTPAGQAYCWGTDVYGQTGDGRDTGHFCSPGPDDSCDNGRFQHPVPRLVQGGLTFTQLAAGYGHACGITTSGEAWCWGANFSGELGTDNSAGLSGLCSTGTSTHIPCSDAPVRVESGGIVFSSIIASKEFTCALSSASRAFCWGSNGSGWLGNGTTTPSDRPVAVAGNQTFAALSASYIHVCGVTTAGAAYCWGNNYDGELGDGTSLNIRTTPVKVVGVPALRNVTAGGATSCGVTTAGVAWCWGKGTFGQLGNGSQASSRTPVRVAGAQTWQVVESGYYHSCGLTTSGEAYCWGIGGGQLGLGYNGAPETCTGFTPCSTIPRLVVAPSSFDAPPAPRATFACNGLTCSFDASPSSDDGTISSFRWDFGDGSTGNGLRVSHRYSGANYYGVGLTVTDAAGQSRSGGEVVAPTSVVDAAPVSRFTFSCSGLTCAFDATSSTDDAGITHYRWHFGDNTPFSSGVRTNHAFRTAGTYRVTLTVTDTRNQVHSSANFVVAGAVANSPPAPVIQRPFNLASYVAGQPIPFLGSATDPEDGTLHGSTFVWTSSRDGQLASGTDTFSASSLSIGTHVITLAATDSRGASGTASVTITITGSASNRPPVANFTWSCNANRCSITSTSTDADGDALTCTWRSDNASHVDKTGCSVSRRRLASNAAWRETLTVRDGRGGTASVTRRIQP